MNDSKLTNKLLGCLLVVSLAQLWLLMERSVEADTLRLDSCITQRMDETPEQYLHVIAHAPVAKSETAAH